MKKNVIVCMAARNNSNNEKEDIPTMSKNDQFQFGCDLFVCVFNNNNSSNVPAKKPPI